LHSLVLGIFRKIGTSNAVDMVAYIETRRHNRLLMSVILKQPCYQKIG
jgi:hypothetical protein